MKFDLEKAISSWRQQLEHRRVFMKEDLDELDRHLRDHFATLVDRGVAPDDAFVSAVRELGTFDDAEHEYRKVYWGKLRQRRSLVHELILRLTMFKNYVLVSLRNARKNPVYTVINVTGLAVAIAAALLVALYVRHELSYDRFHERIDDIYQVGERPARMDATYLLTRAKLLPAILDQIPAVETGTRIMDGGSWMTAGDKRFSESGLYVDSTFFDVLTFPLLTGDPETALDRKDGIVLSQKLAKKYFGDENPVGQTITLDFTDVRTVTGVMRDFPSSSSLQADYLRPFTEDVWPGALNWSNTNVPTLLVVHDPADRERVETQIAALLSEHNPDADAVTVSLFPFKRKHLDAPGYQVGSGGGLVIISVLAMIGFVILLIASINFANLATARSLTRAREIGMRKVIGARRTQLVAQFMGEALLLSYVAAAIGVVVAYLLLPTFNYLLSTELTVNLGTDVGLWAILLGIASVVGLMAGLYPAARLSRFNPVDTLKGTPARVVRGISIRKVLVVTQFALSIVLVVGTLVIWRQIDYMKHRDLHFDAEGIVNVALSPYDFEDPDAAMTRIETMKQELARNSRIVGTSSSLSVPGRYAQWGYGFTPEGSDQRVQATWAYVDADYFDLWGIDLVEGRAFSKDLASDVGTKAVINETARAAFGWKQAVGKTLQFGDNELEVIGVARDFNYTSLESAIKPVVHILPNGPNQYRVLSVKISPGPVQPVLAFIQDKLHELDPARTFDYQFADQQFDALYRSVERGGQLATAFALLAILIACLGLFGLAAYATAQRTKEIGIRKVMGASVVRVVMMISSDFTRLVLVAFVVAIPVAYLLMDRWLDEFAYRIDVPWLAFAVAGAGALLIALLSVSYQALKVAIADPVHALRSE